MSIDANKDWPLEPFNTEADAHTLKHSWEEWRETFELVLESKHISNQREMFVLLLTRGGKDIREIHKNQAPCEDEEIELKLPRLELPVYDNAIARLNKYFGGKINIRMELERFRGMKQEKDEDFAKFLLRLRAQAKHCAFNVRSEEEILHQATRGALDEKVRDKRIDVAITLDQLAQYAIGREILNEQKKTASAFDLKTETAVMAVARGGKTRPVNQFRYDSRKRSAVYERKTECGNCGSWRHQTGTPNCPAKKMKCFNCGKLGHVAAKCRQQKKSREMEVRNVTNDWADETPKREASPGKVTNDFSE